LNALSIANGNNRHILTKNYRPTGEHASALFTRDSFIGKMASLELIQHNAQVSMRDRADEKIQISPFASDLMNAQYTVGNETSRFNIGIVSPSGPRVISPRLLEVTAERPYNYESDRSAAAINLLHSPETQDRIIRNQEAVAALQGHGRRDRYDEHRMGYIRTLSPELMSFSPLQRQASIPHNSGGIICKAANIIDDAVAWLTQKLGGTPAMNSIDKMLRSPTVRHTDAMHQTGIDIDKVIDDKAGDSLHVHDTTRIYRPNDNYNRNHPERPFDIDRPFESDYGMLQLSADGQPSHNDKMLHVNHPSRRIYSMKRPELRVH
jgi:hypothetical protein